MGIQPARLIGHSIGEYVAACLAGVFSFRDCLRIVAARGRLMQSMQPGQMVSVAAAAAAVAPLLGTGVEICAVNARSSVSSGARKLRSRRFCLGCAARTCDVRSSRPRMCSSTRMMEDMLPEFRRIVAEAARSAPKIPFISNVTGSMITESQALDPEYWVSHVRNPGALRRWRSNSGAVRYRPVCRGGTRNYAHGLLREAGLSEFRCCGIRGPLTTTTQC